MSFWSSVVSAISAVAGLFQGYENRAYQERLMKEGWQWQENMQQKQFEQNLFMYEKQKQDNSYAGQLEQLQKAGLSPAMLAQSTFQPAQASSSPSSPSPASMPYTSVPLLGDSVAQIYDTMLKERTVKKLDIENDYLPSLNDAALKKAAAEFDKLVADKLLTEEQRNQIVEMLPLLKNKTKAEIDELHALYAKIEAETKGLDQDARYKRWKNDFLVKFGFNPESPSFNAILQALVSGKANVVLDSMFNTIKGIFNDSDLVNEVKKGYDKLYEEEKKRMKDKLEKREKKRQDRMKKQEERANDRRKRFDVSSPMDFNSTYFRHGR